jgi:NDP-sugar pyrophosphorylase family protein
MQVVIIAGGQGTRIRSVASDIPKALIPVAGRPFIEHQFELLRASGLRDIVLCVGFLGDQLEDHVGDGSRFGVRVHYARESPERLLGTGGALVHALPLLAPEFMVLYGDSYLRTDYRRVIDQFQAVGLDALMCVYHNHGQWDRSNARVEGNRVVYYSKNASPDEVDFIDYGLTLYRRRVIESYRNVSPPLDLQKILVDQISGKGLAACIMPDRFYEIGKPEGLAELEALLTDAKGPP